MLRFRLPGPGNNEADTTCNEIATTFYNCNMQQVEGHKGVFSKSQLFDSLKNYLNTKNRLQPIIGLGSITECVKAGTHNREVLYLCEVCVCRLSKADMLNHILGSIHRYNYIKVWHPHLVSEWKKSELSNLARPLMQMAKVLEGKEGPGDVQRIEVEDDVYQRMATLSENDAVSLITILRDGQGNPESHSGTIPSQNYPVQSQRIVLLTQNQDRQTKNSLKIPSETNQTVTFVEPKSWENNTSSDLSVLSEKNILEGYTGTKSIIGVFRMVECRGEDGQTHCFLCHCCRIRSSKKDLIDHLTGSSHLMNYLMEKHPEKVKIIMADVDYNSVLLQSLAKKVEQEEGRGVPTVVNVPESLCSLLVLKSYHWCIKMLCNEGAHTNIQKPSPAKGASVSKTLHQDMPVKGAVMRAQWAKKMTAKKKKRKASNTVFNVSLPLSKGSMLLKRTSFSMDSLPVSSASDSDPIPSPGPQSEDCEFDYHTASFALNPADHTSQVCLDQDYFKDNKYLEEPEDKTATTCQTPYYDGDDDDYNNTSERSHEWFNNKPKNEYQQTQYEWPTPAVSQSQKWSSSNPSHWPEVGCTEQWYNSTSQAQVGTTAPRENKWNEVYSGESQFYYQQQPQTRYKAHSDVAKIQMQPHLGYPLTHSGRIAPEPIENFDIAERQLQTYTEFPIGPGQTVSHSYVTPPVAHQVIPGGQWMMSNPSYNIGRMTTPNQHFPHPVSNVGGDWAYVPVNWF